MHGTWFLEVAQHQLVLLNWPPGGSRCLDYCSHTFLKMVITQEIFILFTCLTLQHGYAIYIAIKYAQKK